MQPRPEAKTRILEAALKIVRTKGYSGTRVEDICLEAGLTKGAFFHYFDSKEDLAVRAADYWSEITGALFADAPYHAPEDPLDRLLAYVDFRRALLGGAVPEFTCFVGTMVQEAYDTHPAIREACARSITGHAETLVGDIEAARRRHGVTGEWNAESLALYTQATIQGAFILAKATQSTAIAEQCLDHLRRYIELLFRKTDAKEELS
jgi:TetR/AcrR family transcriptional repressor of nem operon